jgi:hypothetical protein
MHRSNGRLFMLQAELADWDKATTAEPGRFPLESYVGRADEKYCSEQTALR